MHRSIWRPVATFSILVATIGGCIYYFATHPAVRQQLSQTSLVTLAIIFLLYLVFAGALSLVTLATLRVCDVRLDLREGSLLTMYATVINFFGPLQSGPAFRAVYLKRKHGLKLKKYTLATLVYYGLFAIISGVFLLSGVLGWWLLLAIAIGLLVLLGLYRSQHPLAVRIRNLQLSAVYLLAAATLLQLMIVAIIYYVELRAVSPGVHLGQAIIYAGAANFALFVSLTPGAIGFRESFLLFSQRLHHIDSSSIIAANVIDRAMYIVLLGVIGIAIFGTHAQRRLQAPAESGEPGAERKQHTPSE